MICIDSKIYHIFPYYYIDLAYMFNNNIRNLSLGFLPGMEFLPLHLIIVLLLFLFF